MKFMLPLLLILETKFSKHTNQKFWLLVRYLKNQFELDTVPIFGVHLPPFALFDYHCMEMENVSESQILMFPWNKSHNEIKVVGDGEGGKSERVFLYKSRNFFVFQYELAIQRLN